MSDTDIKTLLPLDRWAQIIGLNPMHFRQVQPPQAAQSYDTCGRVWKEHPWQHSDALSRDDVAQAIQQTEETFAELLGYRLLPTWEVADRIMVPIPGDMSLFNLNARSPRGYASSVRAKFGHFVEAGIEAKVLIKAAVAVVYTDADSDTYFETATISFATTVTDPQEIAVFYPGQSGADKWEIRPWRTCSISGGVCTMTFWRHQMVIASQIEALSPEAVNGSDAALFLTAVDVYRRYNDPSTQCTLIWKPQANDACGTCCDDTTQTGCLYARDHETGRLAFEPADWNATTEDFDAACLSVGRSPDQLLLYYRAGYRDMRRTYPLTQMDPEMERAIAYYSLSLLRRELCGCSNAEAIVKYWANDVGYKHQFGEGNQLSPEDRDCPLGTTRGALYAWKLIRRRRITAPVDY